MVQQSRWRVRHRVENNALTADALGTWSPKVWDVGLLETLAKNHLFPTAQPQVW